MRHVAKNKTSDETMKKRDCCLVAAVFLLAGILWAVTVFLQEEDGSTLCISVDNEIYGSYSLLEDQEITIGETNVCKIENGEAFMISGQCPDQVCVHSHPISKKGETIICMPNRVVLEITEGVDADVDIMAQ